MATVAVPDSDGLRRVTLACAGASAAVAVALLAIFWLLLSPAQEASCNTSLLPSTFRSALAPVHAAAALVVSLCLCAMSARRRGRAAPGIPTMAVLGVMWVYVGACFVEPELFTLAGFVGVFAGPTLGLGGLLVLAVRTGLAMRSDKPQQRLWRDHAISAQVLLWGGLLVGLPASISYAWLSGANPFCF